MHFNNNFGPSAKVTGLKCSQGVFSSLETENVETREVGDVGDVEDKVESFASKRISRTWPTWRGSRCYDGNQTLVLKVEDNECETVCGGLVLSDFFHETSRGCACPNGNRFEEFTKMSLEVLSDIGRKQIDEDKIGQVTLPSLKISICEVSRRLHRMPPNWSKPLCISKPVIQELSEFQEDPTLQNIIFRVSKEFVPSFHHDQMFLLSVSMIHDENSFSHLHQWLDFDCFRMQTKLRTHSWLTFFAWVLQDCITWYPKGLIDLPIIYIQPKSHLCMKHEQIILGESICPTTTKLPKKMQVLTNADRQKSFKSPPTKRTKPLIYILKANSSTTYRLQQEQTYQVSQNDLHIKNISAN